MGGSDTVSYAHSAHYVSISLGSQIAWDGYLDTLSSIENAIGTRFDDDITGDGGANVLDGAAGIDRLTGMAGDDTFAFVRGQGNGDIVDDFAGNGGAAGDSFRFSGYGTAAQGATFTQVDTFHWSINSADGLVHDIITLGNAASVHASDYLFV
jgi:Ca2+-binding RTX toxin-like protein